MRLPDSNPHVPTLILRVEPATAKHHQSCGDEEQFLDHHGSSKFALSTGGGRSLARTLLSRKFPDRDRRCGRHRPERSTTLAPQARRSSSVPTPSRNPPFILPPNHFE